MSLQPAGLYSIPEVIYIFRACFIINSRVSNIEISPWDLASLSHRDCGELKYEHLWLILSGSVVRHGGQQWLVMLLLRYKEASLCVSLSPTLLESEGTHILCATTQSWGPISI